MRDVNRIDPFLERLGEIWKERFPDLRFGQMMFNFFSAFGDPFYLEEDEFLTAFEAYCKGEDPRAAVRALLEEKLEKYINFTSDEEQK